MKKIFTFFTLTILFLSCKKTQFDDIKKDVVTLKSTENLSPLSARMNTESSNCEDCDAIEASYTDTIDHPTILGDAILNPYTLPNMTQAYYNMYGGYPSPALAVTHYYVKFSPTNLSQLAAIEDEDIDLTSFPLDKELIFEGDFYLQPGKALEDLPDLWAVVPVNYLFPPAIPHIIITEMHIPDDVPVLEDEALYLTGNLGDNPADYNTTNGDKSYLDTRARRIAFMNNLDCDCTCPDPNVECVLPGYCFDPGSCGGGGGGGGGGGSTNCSHYPKGKILVQNKLATDFSYRGVRNVRVVIRRTFKVDRLFTDDNGNFVTTKYFRNNYTILTKFKNQYARTARIRPWALWEQYFPIKINFGRWKNLPCNFEFRINNPTANGTIQTSHWAAATTLNGVIEHREMSQQEAVGVPYASLHILLSKNSKANSGNTYMFNKMIGSGAVIPPILISSGIAALPAVGSVVNLITALWSVRAPDIKFGYGGNYLSFLSTDQYCELVYHELSHSAHYTQVGNSWWLNFGLNEYFNPGSGTYGACCQSTSERIAVGEGWAYHFGHYLADLKWGSQCTTFPEQGTDIGNFENTLLFSNGGGYSSQHNFLENYNPKRELFLDPNRWLPKGIFNDMMDPTGNEPPQSQIVDNISGFTNQQFYQALQNDVNSMSDYKARFLQQNNYLQQTQINELFNEYGF